MGQEKKASAPVLPVAENNPFFLSYLLIWRDPTIPEASVFSIQMLDKYLGTWGQISDDKITNEIDNYWAN